ncbi:MAG: hypothetical protein AABZ94_08885 [Candidatus Eisenbacteria bacterium]
MLGLWRFLFERTLGAVWRAFVRLARWTAGEIVATDTLRIVLNATSGYGAPVWGMGTVNGVPSMQVTAHWTVTNVTDKPIRIAAVRLARPRVEGHVHVSHPTREQSGPYLLPPNVPMPMSTMFWVTPPMRKPGQNLASRVVFVDNLDNEIKSATVVFHGRKAN